jgi:hypothetical protein
MLSAWEGEPQQFLPLWLESKPINETPNKQHALATLLHEIDQRAAESHADVARATRKASSLEFLYSNEPILERTMDFPIQNKVPDILRLCHIIDLEYQFQKQELLFNILSKLLQHPTITTNFSQLCLDSEGNVIGFSDGLLCTKEPITVKFFKTYDLVLDLDFLNKSLVTKFGASLMNNSFLEYFEIFNMLDNPRKKTLLMGMLNNLLISEQKVAQADIYIQLGLRRFSNTNSALICDFQTLYFLVTETSKNKIL